MKVIIIGSDRQIFNLTSTVRQRASDYSDLIDETRIIVFAKKSLGFIANQVSPKLWIYPTNSKLKIFYIFDAIRLARKLKWQADFITCQDPFESGLTGWLIRRRQLIKLELQIHTDIGSPYFQRKSLKNKVRYFLAKFLLPKADRIRVVSQRIKNHLISNLGIAKNKIYVKPIFVNVEKIKNTPITADLHKKYPQFDKIILMASRLTREKNVNLAIKAMHEIIKQKPKTGLIIVGSGSEEQKLKLKTKSYNLEASIIFEPWVSQEVLYSYYKTADLFLLTSMYEGYGMTLIEANVCECPVVSTDVGIAGEITPYVCSVTDDDCVVKKVLQIIS